MFYLREQPIVFCDFCCQTLEKNDPRAFLGSGLIFDRFWGFLGQCQRPSRWLTLTKFSTSLCQKLSARCKAQIRPWPGTRSWRASWPTTCPARRRPRSRPSSRRRFRFTDRELEKSRSLNPGEAIISLSGLNIILRELCYRYSMCFCLIASGHWATFNLKGSVVLAFGLMEALIAKLRRLVLDLWPDYFTIYNCSWHM